MHSSQTTASSSQKVKAGSKDIKVTMAEPRNGYILQLSEQDIEKAKKNLNENPEETPARVRDLRAALQQRKHLSIRDDDEFLLMFLRQARFSQEKALEAIENLAKLRVTPPYDQVYTNKAQLSPTTVELLEKGVIFVTPRLSESSGRAVIVRPGLIDTDKISAQHLHQAGMVTLEIAMLDPVTQIHGLVRVMDFRGCGLMKAAKMFPPQAMKMAGATLVNSLPLRNRAVHLCHAPLLIHGAFTLIKPLFSRDVSSQFFSHRSQESLVSVLEPGLVPEELGGTAGACEDLARQWYLHVQKHLDYFDTFASTRYEEVGGAEGGEGPKE